MHRRRTGQGAAWAFIAPVAAYLLAFYAYPLYRNLDLSLRNYTVRSFVQGDAPFTGLANYRTVVDDPTFAPALLHTAVFAVSIPTGATADPSEYAARVDPSENPQQGGTD